MQFNIIGKDIKRYDAIAKVTGKAKYTSDFNEPDMLIGKIFRSSIAHGTVKKIDVSKARAAPGVEAVITFEDVPQTLYPTAGHPYSLEPETRDIADKTILTKKVRYYGDEIAAVVAVDELTANRALKLIEIEYEPAKVITSIEESLGPDPVEIHQNTGNIVKEIGWETSDIKKAFEKSDYIFEDEFETRMVQHCSMENHTSYAYIDHNQRLVIVSSTQIPHIVRRIVSQALGMSISKIRVIKPFVGGGFGSKQDACLEPLNAALTLAVKGRPVKIELTREESMIGTRVRHAVKYKLKTGVSKEGKITARELTARTAKGAYASHGIAPIAKNGSMFKLLYPCKAVKFKATSAYSNHPSAGAMRAYGVPQIKFALESHIDNIARRLNIDPIDFRLKNLIKEGFKDESFDIMTCGIQKCIEKGRDLIEWDKKRKEYENQTGSLRKGVGMACFCYTTGTFPVCLEVAGARLILRQDGSVTLQVGATEIGQGSDTVLSQMAAEILGIPADMVYLESMTDTDFSPFDTGAYASRQTYVSGAAVKKAAIELKAKILYQISLKRDLSSNDIDIENGYIVYKKNREQLISMTEAGFEIFYDRETSSPLTADVSKRTQTNCVAFGTSFTEVEVDMETGKIIVLKIFNIHDSGKIINRSLGAGQVHGGVSMGIGYALSEELKFDPKTARPLNNNLLDYKIPTIMDTPDIGVEFVETFDPTAPFGNKALGEPPTITPAPAIRNAVLHATGVEFNLLPMNPQRAFEKFKTRGLI